MRKRVLLVDDERSIVTALRVRLEANGYEVEAVFDGSSVLRAADRFGPDAIVLDIRMPDLDGFAVCRALKQTPHLAAPPVVFVSANNVETARAEAERSGGAAFIAKPYHAGEILETLERVIEHAQAGVTPASTPLTYSGSDRQQDGDGSCLESESTKEG